MYRHQQTLYLSSWSSVPTLLRMLVYAQPRNNMQVRLKCIYEDITATEFHSLGPGTAAALTTTASMGVYMRYQSAHRITMRRTKAANKYGQDRSAR